MLMRADPSRQESLQTEAELDPMEGEQTWPSESELKEAEGEGSGFTAEGWWLPVFLLLMGVPLQPT